jgi:hypothetical protein
MPGCETCRLLSRFSVLTTKGWEDGYECLGIFNGTIIADINETPKWCPRQSRGESK